MSTLWQIATRAVTVMEIWMPVIGLPKYAHFLLSSTPDCMCCCCWKGALPRQPRTRLLQHPGFFQQEATKFHHVKSPCYTRNRLNHIDAWLSHLQSAVPPPHKMLFVQSLTHTQSPIFHFLPVINKCIRLMMWYKDANSSTLRLMNASVVETKRQAGRAIWWSQSSRQDRTHTQEMRWVLCRG